MIVVVALMVGPSHSIARKTDTPELVREDTGRQAQLSCIQYAVAPAANGDHTLTCWFTVRKCIWLVAGRSWNQILESS